MEGTLAHHWLEGCGVFSPSQRLTLGGRGLYGQTSRELGHLRGGEM
jgi:hypothetical protein